MSEENEKLDRLSHSLPSEVSRLIFYYKSFSYLIIFLAITDALDIITNNNEYLDELWKSFLSSINELGNGEDLAKHLAEIGINIIFFAFFVLLSLIVFSNKKANAWLTESYVNQNFKIHYNILGHFKGEWIFSNSFFSKFFNIGAFSFRRTFVGMTVTLLIFTQTIKLWTDSFNNLGLKNAAWMIVMCSYFPIVWSWAVIQNLEQYKRVPEFSEFPIKNNMVDIVVSISLIFILVIYLNWLVSVS